MLGEILLQAKTDYSIYYHLIAREVPMAILGTNGLAFGFQNPKVLSFSVLNIIQCHKYVGLALFK